MSTENSASTVDRYKSRKLVRCIDNGGSSNLTPGELYLANDALGTWKQVNISVHISNNDSFIGTYTTDKFEVVMDMTEDLKKLPFMNYTPVVAMHDIRPSLLQFIAKKNAWSLNQAQLHMMTNNLLDNIILTDDDVFCGAVLDGTKRSAAQPKYDLPPRDPSKVEEKPKYEPELKLPTTAKTDTKPGKPKQKSLFSF